MEKLLFSFHVNYFVHFIDSATYELISHFSDIVGAHSINNLRPFFYTPHLFKKPLTSPLPPILHTFPAFVTGIYRGRLFKAIVFLLTLLGPIQVCECPRSDRVCSLDSRVPCEFSFSSTFPAPFLYQPLVAFLSFSRGLGSHVTTHLVSSSSEQHLMRLSTLPCSH